ncbi:two-component system response regulator [Maritimibacter sp. 55A14]|uniref:response regulator transcription factor n=1 Tax=Maritimibacter sp. 55A14 TaxID=2174844 RepID=UPI000D605DA4|nr:response regulator [Maritimibacter sp. 55A14]PWE33867.1 two-component system response regulator [Maritimibacter sp. 55A14]
MEEKDDRKSVLLIEDEDNIALALEFLMQRQGYRVERIASGAGALEHVAAARPDLVVSDVMLPEVSGYEICQRIKAAPALSAIKVMILTARGTEMERRKALALGADGFLSKPFDTGELLSQVAGLLERA